MSEPKPHEELTASELLEKIGQLLSEWDDPRVESVSLTGVVTPEGPLWRLNVYTNDQRGILIRSEDVVAYDASEMF